LARVLPSLAVFAVVGVVMFGFGGGLVGKIVACLAAFARNSGR